MISLSDVPCLLSTRRQHYDTPLGRLRSVILVHLPDRVFLALGLWLHVDGAIATRQEEARSSLDDLPCDLVSLFSCILLEPLVPCVVFGFLGPRSL